jgi:Leucine-rich repeat (LRR) protein
MPEEFKNLTSLEVLDLSGNRLAVIPDLLGFQNLRILWLASNRFTSLPSLCDLPLLEDLDVECNSLDSMPVMMSASLYLKRINIAGLLPLSSIQCA